MNKRYEISKPKEGIKTLSAQFSLVRLEKTIDTAKKMRRLGKTEQEVSQYVNSQHSDLDFSSRKKIYQISLGELPADDLLAEDVENISLVNETTLSLTLKKAMRDTQEGSLIFYQGKRWVVVGLNGLNLDLKQI